jgi:hypothetical protein
MIEEMMVGQHPGRLRRRRGRQIEVVGVVGIADQRPKDEAALVRDQLLQIGIAIIGGGLEIAAERGLRIADEGRKIQMPVEFDEERPIVGDQFGKQRDEEQNEKNPQRPVAAAVRFEVLPAAAIERRHGEPVARHRHGFAERRLRGGFDRRRRDDRHQTSRASKSIRGSIHM